MRLFTLKREEKRRNTLSDNQRLFQTGQPRLLTLQSDESPGT